MSRNYEDFPENEFKHCIENGHNEYRNKFFHDIDLAFILKWMSDLNLELRVHDNMLQLLLNGEVISEVPYSGGGEYPVYTGPTNVVPKRASQTLYTEEKTVLDDIEVDGIPYYETSNVKGLTAIIGGNG